MKRIKSLQNPAVKSILHLRKKNERDKSGLILIEGTREISLARKGGIKIYEIFFPEGALSKEDGKEISKRLESEGERLIMVGPQIFEKISYRGSSSSVIGIAKKPERSLKDMPVGDGPLYIVMDDVEKPGNLGAVLRSADGAGVTGVIASDERTDLYNPNVIRASLGTIFTVPTVATTSEEAIEWLRSNGVQIVVTTPGADKLYTEIDLTGPTAVVVGSEDKGVRQEWLDAADIKVKIPMLGAADSLNVAQSATILVYEALRQRSAVGK